MTMPFSLILNGRSVFMAVISAPQTPHLISWASWSSCPAAILLGRDGPQSRHGHDRRQAERTQSFEEYVRRRVTPWVVRRGRELAAEHRELLAQIRERYGVPPEIVVAIWGIESGFGQYGGTVPVFQALATLAWDPRRARLFRAQLYDALTMVDRGHIDAPSMVGSWAGAMGQPQFMPSSYLAYAVDFDGDGRRDIWMSPADTFASIANYLAGHGWRADEPWGYEVRVRPRVVQRATRTLKHRDSGCRAMRETIGPARL